MIETAMIFALGFLVASLCCLLVLPAVNARAARLARRRAEAMLPLSPGEIVAERDFLRAQFAVQQRRLERAVDEARAKRHADMAAIGTGTMRAAALTRDVAARDAEIAQAQARRQELEAELAGAREDGRLSLATLQALEEAHADLLDSLLAARQRAGSAGRVAASPVSTSPQVGADKIGADRDGADHAATDAADAALTDAALLAERDALRASLAAAEDALAQALAARGEGVERENADLRRRIGEVADALTGRERLPRAGAFAVPERV